MKPIIKAKTGIPVKNIDWHLLVKEMIESRFISKKNLAERCNVGKVSVYNWKNNIKTPRPWTKQKLLEIAQKEGIALVKFEIVSASGAIKKCLEKNQGKALVRLFELYQKMSRRSRINLLRYGNTLVK